MNRSLGLEIMLEYGLRGQVWKWRGHEDRVGNLRYLHFLMD
jgi:hypothetical protein